VQAGRHGQFNWRTSLNESAAFPRDDVDTLDRIEFPAPGTVRRGMLRFSHPDLAEWAWPYTVVRGAQDGPHAALISGVHPAEYPAIEGNIRVTRSLDPARLRGTVVSLPLIDVPAFLPRSPFVCPIDGKNPNRFFPGDPEGTFTEVMDDAIFRTVIAPADVLIDLHGGDMVEALYPFSVYSVSGNEAVDARSLGMAKAFGLPYVVASRPQPGGLAGTTVDAAAAVGIPAVIAESGSSGLLTEPETLLMVDGIENTLRYLGVLEGEVLEPPVTEVDRFTWLRSPAEGMWYPSVTTGEQVRKGQNIGRIGSLYGDTLAEIVAPHDGAVLFITSAAAMPRDGLIISIGG
jgi:predicted deacylase